MFSTKHSFAEKKCKLKRNRNLPNIGGCSPACIKEFFQLFEGFWWFCFLFSVFWCFCFVKRPKRLFACDFRGFFHWNVCSPKRPVFVLFFLFCFCSLLSFCHPFQNSIFFLCFLSINPFLGNIILFLVSSVFPCLPYPLLMFASFLETNFPNIPF